MNGPRFTTFVATPDGVGGSLQNWSQNRGLRVIKVRILVGKFVIPSLLTLLVIASPRVHVVNPLWIHHGSTMDPRGPAITGRVKIEVFLYCQRKYYVCRVHKK